MPHFNFCFLFITTVIKQELILHFIAQGKKFINKVKKTQRMIWSKLLALDHTIIVIIAVIDSCHLLIVVYKLY